MLARIRTAIAKRRLERLVTRQRASFDAARSEAAKKGHATRKATDARGRYNRFISDPIVRQVLTGKQRRSEFKLKSDIRCILAERDGMDCHWCKGKLQMADACKPMYATLDHIIPHSVGGSNQPHNLVLACSKCNGARGSVESHIPKKVHHVKRLLLAEVIAA